MSSYVANILCWGLAVLLAAVLVIGIIKGRGDG